MHYFCNPITIDMLWKTSYLLFNSFKSELMLFPLFVKVFTTFGKVATKLNCAFLQAGIATVVPVSWAKKMTCS